MNGVTNPTIATDTTGLPSVSLSYVVAAPAPPITPVLTPPVVTPPRAAFCKVPDLSGRTLKAARKVLQGVNCKLGAVKRKSKEPRKIVGQTPKPGKSLAAGSSVDVTLAGGHRRQPR